MFERIKKSLKPDFVVKLDEYPIELEFKVKEKSNSYVLKPWSASEIYSRFGDFTMEIAKGEDIDSSIKKNFKEFILPEYHRQNEAEESREKIYENILSEIKTKKVLDVGCGSGKFAAMAMREGHDVFCVDVNDKLIKEAKERTPYCVKASAERLPFKGHSFDDETLTASYSIYLTNHEKTFSEMRRVGGDIIITPNNSDLWKYYKKILKDMCYEIDNLKNFFRARP